MPKKKFVVRDKYFTFITYEYRGCEYEVKYANGWNVCCTPSWIQHRDEQQKIDNILDSPKTESNFKAENASVGFELFWEYVNAD